MKWDTWRRSACSEFASRDPDLCAYGDVTLDFSRPGKPTDNAFIDPSTPSWGTRQQTADFTA
ncbi:hypothetical protein IVB11_36935 [Bradyrhizobium sp. 177]|nr:hypothetical protein [Bradyrhizobium sp. 177]